jgi:hypothetical protein
LSGIPPYLSPGQIGRACGLNRRKVLRLLRRAGVAELIGDRWAIGESALRERLPEVYDRVYLFFVTTAKTDRT